MRGPPSQALYPLSVIAAVTLGLIYPAFFIDWKSVIIPLLVVIMFMMGLTVKAKDIIDTLRAPKAILVGMCLQFLFMPLIGLALGIVLK